MLRFIVFPSDDSCRCVISFKSPAVFVRLKNVLNEPKEKKK